MIPDTYERPPSPAMRAFLKVCDDEFERVRLESLKEIVGVKEVHLRKFITVLSVNVALNAKRQVMRYPPEELRPEEAEIERHYGRLLGQLASHDKLLAKVTAEAEAAEAERERGRTIARRNAQVGAERAAAAIEAELDRHEGMVARLTAPEAIAAEDKRHTARMAELELKAEGALAALDAVTDAPEPSAADTTDAVSDSNDPV